MKFTDGQWLLQPGVSAHYATEARSITAGLTNRPDYDYEAGVTFRVYELADGSELTCEVSTRQNSESVRLSVHRAGNRVTARVAGDPSARWQLQLAGTHVTSAENGARTVSDPLGIMAGPAEGSNQIELIL